MAPSQSLPLEVVELIIHFLYVNSTSTAKESLNSADQTFLDQSSIKQLLSLRLLGEPWAAAVPKFVESSLYLTKPLCDNNKAYWEAVLNSAGGPHLKEAINLKTFILITGDGDPIKDPEVAKVFEAHGISCHFRSEISHTDILAFMKN
ncbi:uncharacterized protein MELLADRAFT_112428 [Melampsora larici-populina 98AG31]|uniref:Uncharacterized protein n=1 Tax=Melampsora larici-populina (strain 98AG31 / pathotype 3-4-7) TaxID=747676 RepID=F4RZA1_MELLP|nr:uncharacterized protein MELLADRAFT_110287 [Melampsora larici-populina 98AG31]XP_007417015.1 uncharacterized protein MELLADRAFT_112428 [Melampsora larici-populina 98AG31]EGF99684.1 hypothetical protein MELLADRAFT_112428 [Melampsora larici-populina 98AG31]EGG02188.1 hypothetical protein MELLADRAFT_110287 [Melampsora larici-populina 98AG31]